MGFVFIGDDAETTGFYFCTRTILNFFGKSELFQNKRWLLLDSNFKVTAYTSNPVHIKLLQLFSFVTYSMPGFTSAFISPDSFSRAIQKGTTFNDIVSFLNSNLIQTIGNGEIPKNVQRQFKVWEQQRNRLMFQADCILRKFHNREDAELAANAASEMFGLVKFLVKDQYITTLSHQKMN